MSIYDEETKTKTYVILPCCFIRTAGWIAKHKWRWTAYGKVCERCGAKIVVQMPEVQIKMEAEQRKGMDTPTHNTKELSNEVEQSVDNANQANPTRI